MAEERERQLQERREERMISPFESEWFDTPWRMLQRMREDIDRMFGEWPAWGRIMQSMPGVRMPAVDVWETDDEVKLRADVPGIEPADLEIYTTMDAVRIRGEMKQEEEQKGKSLYRAERRYGMFDRTIPLPAQIIPDKAKASFKNGVLEIALPKTEQAREKMRKVPIEIQNK